MSKQETIPQGPDKLSNEEVKKILDKIGDTRIDGLSDVEHFVINVGDGKIRIPKREKIYANGRWEKIEDYLKHFLEELS